MEDTRVWEPVTFERALTRPELRRRVARTLGRLADPRGVRYLVDLVDDPDPEVEAEAVHALAQLGADRELPPEGVAALRRAAVSSSRRASRLAVGALARRGLSLSQTEDLLAEFEPLERLVRMVPSLLRLPADSWAEVVRSFFEELELADRQLLAEAFSRSATKPSAWAAELAADSDRWISASGSRAIGRVATSEECRVALESLSSELVSASAPIMVSGALEAVSGCAQRGMIAVSSSSAPALLGFLADLDPSVRSAALSAARWWLHLAEVREAVVVAVRSPSQGFQERRTALESLARAEDLRAADLLVELHGSTDPWLRAAAAGGLAVWKSTRLDGMYLNDSEPVVRAATLDALSLRRKSSTVPVGLIVDGAAEVRAAALDYFSRHPDVAVDDLLTAIGDTESARTSRDPRVRLSLVEALVARGRAERLERGAVLLLLANVARNDPAPEVRRLAALRLLEAGEEAVDWRSALSRRSESYYEAAKALADEPLRLSWTTSKGPFVIEFECRNLEVMCRHLAQLAEQGFFRETRVGAGEVGRRIRLGDPTGTGRGWPGYFVRDADSLTADDRDGSPRVWLDRRWPDTGSGRLVVTLDPAAALDSPGLPIGRVVSGIDTLKKLQMGDSVVAVRVEGADGR